MAEASQQQQQRRLVMFPCPLQGHINPMLQLATILHSYSKGALSITIVHTHFNSPNPSKYPNFTFFPISDGLPPSRIQTATHDVIALLNLLNQNCASPFRDCLVNKILAKQDEPPVACIISDATMHFTQAIADSLHLPRLTLRTASPTNFIVFAAFPLLREKGYIPIKLESEMEAPVPEFPPLKVKDLPTIKTANFGALYQLIGNMIQQTKASSGLIWNSFESLEQASLDRVRQEFPVPSFPIGPFHRSMPASSSSLFKPDRSCISWLDAQPPLSVLYISFGSIAVIDENQLVEMALGIANSDQRFLWVIRPGILVDSSNSKENDDLTELLPAKFNEQMETHRGRGCIVKWAPQQEVLAHPAVGGFWTHNGWNSTLESISEGVPMLCSPSFGDQKGNARYVSQVWNVGFLLENGFEHQEIERYIRRLMVKQNNKEMEEMMVRVRGLKEMAEDSLRKGGSSFESLEKLSDYISSTQIGDGVALAYLSL